MTEKTTEDTPSHGLLYRLRNYFLTGIVVCAPIVLTIYVTLLFLDLIDSRVRSLIPGVLPETQVPGLGLLIAVTFFILIGWFATNFLGKLLINMSEAIVNRTPIIRTIYGGIKQVFEMVMGKQAQAFREAVLVQFPLEGTWALGFVTGTTQGEVQNKTDATVINVFVPTTPNPTSGFLIFVPNEKVVRLKMPVDDALKMVVSGGILTPPDRSQSLVELPAGQTGSSSSV